MRSLRINQRIVYYAPYLGTTPAIDEYGNETGEHTVSYGLPAPVQLNVSAAIGEYESRQFGDSLDYDKVLVGSDPTIPITETTVFWIDDLNLDEPHDYVVKKIARSLNGISIAVRKVDLRA